MNNLRYFTMMVNILQSPYASVESEGEFDFVHDKRRGFLANSRGEVCQWRRFLDGNWRVANAISTEEYPYLALT